MSKQILLCFLFLLAIPIYLTDLIAHPGGLDKNGGHHNRKTEEYHCHKPDCIEKGSSQKHAPQLKISSKKYNRKDWPHWIDEDNDCQNTRAEILIQYSLEPVKFKRNKGCNVSWGKWIGPYTGKVFEKASDLDIDHIVPLAHAHKTGAANWTRKQKRAFANDPENLLPVDDNTNQEKGAKSPARWKPPLESYWCEYARKWRHIKAKYQLSISVPEERSLGVMGRKCK